MIDSVFPPTRGQSLAAFAGRYAPDIPRQAPAGRGRTTCCKTVLSVYNKGQECGPCAVARKAREELEELEKLRGIDLAPDSTAHLWLDGRKRRPRSRSAGRGRSRRRRSGRPLAILITAGRPLGSIRSATRRLDTGAP